MPRRLALHGTRPKPAASAFQDRRSAAVRGYGRRWQRIRLEVLAAEPLCRDPYGDHAGVTVLATDVDHIVPRSVRLRLGLDPDDPANLQPLCHRCHSRKTASEDGGFRR